MNLELKQALNQNRLVHKKFLNDFGLSWFAPAAEKMTDDELLLSAVQICNTFMCEEYDDTPPAGEG